MEMEKLKEVCPHCGSNDLEPYDDDNDLFGNYIQECTCLDCGAQVDLIYKKILIEVR